MAEEPSEIVLMAFGIPKCKAELFPGGQGQTFRCGTAVLKLNLDASEAEWSSELYHQLSSSPDPSFRVPSPILASNNHYVFQSWTAFQYVPNLCSPECKWERILHASRAFHTALKDIHCPDFLARRCHIWAIADRVAWGEDEVLIHPALQPVFRQLQSLRKKVQLPSQLVHGDLTGNTFFTEEGETMILDFSPFWRPVEFAEAVVLVDAVLDHREEEGVFKLMQGVERGQMLVRALLFRVVAWSGYVGLEGRVEEGYIAAFDKATLLVQLAMT